MTDTTSPFGWIAGPRDRMALLTLLGDRPDGSAEQQEIVDLGFSITVVADAIARGEAEITRSLWGPLTIKDAGRAAVAEQR